MTKSLVMSETTTKFIQDGNVKIQGGPDEEIKKQHWRFAKYWSGAWWLVLLSILRMHFFIKVEALSP